MATSFELINYMPQTDIHIKPLMAKKKKDGTYVGGSIYSSTSELYEHLLQGKEGYEYVTEKTYLCKFFWDIDIDDATIKTKSERHIQQYIALLAEILVQFGIKQSCLFKKEHLNVFQISQGHRDIKHQIVSSVVQHTKYTVSNNPDKTSFHIVHTNLVFVIRDIVHIREGLRRHMENMSKQQQHKNKLFTTLLQGIDFVVWKPALTLRCPFSIKSQTDKSFHVCDPQEFADLLITYIPHEDFFCLVNPISINNNNDVGTLIREMEHVFMTKIDSSRFFNTIEDVFKHNLLNKFDYGDTTVCENQQIELNIDYSQAGCGLCGKRFHKNKHFAFQKENTIVISKRGNSKNCKTLNIKLDRNGSELLAIAIKIHMMGDTRRYKDTDIIVWTGQAWSFIQNTFNVTSYILSKRDCFSGREKGMVEEYNKRRLIEKNLIDILGAEKSIKQTENPFMFFFQNGVYNIYESTFYEGDAAKEFVSEIHSGYDYDPDWEENPKIVDAVAFLTKVLDEIQFPDKENTENKELFEIVLGSCLLGSHKEYITFFLGGTMAGKSTVKKIIRAALGNAFVETSSSLLLQDIDPKKPNPFLASIHLKRSVFASELPNTASSDRKIKAVNIKKFTEQRVMSRLCYSNVTEQINISTMIVDTNHHPYFDSVDSAVIRRCVLIDFKSAFIDTEDNVAGFLESDRKIFKINMKISSMLNTPHFMIAAFVVLERYFLKHFKKHGEFLFCFRTTPEKFPDFNFLKKITTLVQASSPHLMDRIITKHMKHYKIVDDMPCIRRQIFTSLLGEHFASKKFLPEMNNFIEEHAIDEEDGQVLKFVFKTHLTKLNKVNE